MSTPALLAATWPTSAELFDILRLADYNTRVVVLGVTFLGIAAGLIGSFLLLRKRALLGDALSHATLPGIGVAFLVLAALGGSGKWLPGLLLGATLSGVAGVLTILLIVHTSRIKEDAALGIVLSVYFGLGVAITGIIQSTDTGNAAGLKSFIYGKTASMLLSDALLLAGAAGLAGLVCLLLYKEFTLLCFDLPFARAQGWPVLGLDIALTGVVVVVTVIGLQAVGLILMVALLVIPPAAARFWTERLGSMLLWSALFGAASGYLGAVGSALLPRLPAGALIVLAAGLLFGLSLVFGTTGGLLVRVWRHVRLTHRMSRQHLLRAMYELSELEGSTAGTPAARAIAPAELHEQRSWSRTQLRRALRAAERAGLVARRAAPDGPRYQLTPAGADAAWRVARNHRLWELYLIAHADIAASHVDRDADEVEHVLEPAMIHELETLLRDDHPDLAAPRSPHRLSPVGGGS